MSSESFREWLLEGQSSGIIPGQLPPHNQRGRSLSRVTRCVAAAAKLELSDPLTAPHPRAKPQCPLWTLHSSLAGRRHHHNYRHSTASRRANAATTIAAPRHARQSHGRTAASVRPVSPHSGRCCIVGGLPASDLGLAEAGQAVPPSPAGHGRDARSLPVVRYWSHHVVLLSRLQ